MSSSNTSNTWTTAITEATANHVRVRGYDIAELMGNVSFGQAVYLILRGELPSEIVGKLMEAMLVASIDHGATPPSALAARTVASTGAALSASVAAGISSINEFHGGAIENCARQLAVIVKRCEDSDESPESATKTVLEELKASLRKHESNFSKGEERICVSLTGKTLAAQSTEIVGKNSTEDMKIIHHVPAQAFYLITASERPECKTLLE